MLSRQVWDVVDKGLARGGVGRVPEGEDLEDAVAGLPSDSGPGEHKGEQVALRRAPAARAKRESYLCLRLLEVVLLLRLCTEMKSCLNSTVGYVCTWRVA